MNIDDLFLKCAQESAKYTILPFDKEYAVFAGSFDVLVFTGTKKQCIQCVFDIVCENVMNDFQNSE